MLTMRSLALLSLLASPTCASWVPASPAIPHQGFEPRLQRDLVSRAASNTTGGWPYGPFETKGREVVNSKGEVITWAGVNWPMSGETMVPEGLEFSSVGDILDKVKSVGWNYIRM